MQLIHYDVIWTTLLGQLLPLFSLYTHAMSHDENISELLGSVAHLIFYTCKLLSTGETGIGKSTLINTLFNTTFESDEASHYLHDVHLCPKTYDLQESNVNLKLTIVDTVGFGDQINKEERYCLLFGWNEYSHRKMTQYSTLTVI